MTNESPALRQLCLHGVNPLPQSALPRPPMSAMSVKCACDYVAALQWRGKILYTSFSSIDLRLGRDLIYSWFSFSGSFSVNRHHFQAGGGLSLGTYIEVET